ncbi:class I SAM-dependent methyltransferase, partial [Flavobacterium sp.]|uniref:class I SAM-dependent methyltransferase n=1 Tax=Flavobacterium sp. TaxID=239 RepID=UPI0035294E40
MIEQAKSKDKYENLTFLQFDCLEIHQTFGQNEFNFLFSNFGGLNCLSKEELLSFFENIGIILEQNSKLGLIIMPKNTLWEQFYFSLKGKFSEAFRRKKESVRATVATESIVTFYYNPKDIVTLAKRTFKCIEYKPIGFFIPPSYLEPFVKKHPLVFKILNKLDNWIKNWSFLSKYADHYIIVLEKK